MIALHISMQGGDIIEHPNGKRHLCTMESIYRRLCSIGMHLVRLLTYSCQDISKGN